MQNSSSFPEEPDLSPTISRKPLEIDAEITKNKRFYNLPNEKYEKILEITETEVKILKFLDEIGIKSSSPFEKMFDYYEKIQKPSENFENSADFPKKKEEKIKLNSSLYLKRSKTLKNAKKD